MPEIRLRHLPSALLVLALVGLGVAGCGTDAVDETAPGEPAAAGEAADEGARTYQVRGEVTAVPDPADPLTNLVIRHEAIDDFVGIDGQVVGMGSMSMPFPTAEGVSLDDLRVGDKVAFTLEVDWEGDPAYRIVRLEPLPAATELEYRKAQPPESAAEEVLEETSLGADEDPPDHDAPATEGPERGEPAPAAPGGS